MRHIASAALGSWVARDTSSLWNLYLSAISPPFATQRLYGITKFVAKRENEDQHTNISLCQFFLLISLKQQKAERILSAPTNRHTETLYTKDP